MKICIKLLTFFIVVITMVPLLVSEVYAKNHVYQYSDVTDRYAEAVEFVLSKGGAGLTESNYGITENIKRVDAAILLAKVLELNTEDAPPSGFTDVPERGVKYVNALKEAGITSGKTLTTFDSQAQITRGELAIWLQKGFALEGTGDFNFTDVSERYIDAVQALVTTKVTLGLTDTTFGTNQNATRGQFALFLKRAYDAKQESEVNPELKPEPEIPEVIEIVIVEE